MNSALLRDGDRVLVPPLLLFALYLLMAGHNRPGGGFVAGLTIASAVVLRAQARGAADAVALLRAHPMTLMGIGLVLATAVGAAPLLTGGTFLDQPFAEVDIAVFGPVKFTAALVFDIGVALLVVGVVSAIVEAFGEEDLT
jgi:multisubunit Na+/H+ antiporter MnhB subunit